METDKQILREATDKVFENLFEIQDYAREKYNLAKDASPYDMEAVDKYRSIIRKVDAIVELRKDVVEFYRKDLAENYEGDKNDRD